MIALTIVLSNTTMNGDPQNIAAGVIVCLIACIVVGVANSLLVTLFRIPSIVATLGTFALTSGGAVIYSGGVPTGSIPAAFRMIGQGHLGLMPVSTIIWIAATFLAGLWLHRTVGGRALLACGANPATARQSGISVFVYGVLPYVLSAFGACLGGLVFAAYMGLPDLQVSSLYVLGPIASAVVGEPAWPAGRGPCSAPRPVPSSLPFSRP